MYTVQRAAQSQPPEERFNTVARLGFALPLCRCRSPGTGLLSGGSPDSSLGQPAACGYMCTVVGTL